MAGTHVETHVCVACLEPVDAMPETHRDDGGGGGGDVFDRSADGSNAAAVAHDYAHKALCACASRTWAEEGGDAPMRMPCGHIMHAQCTLRCLLETDTGRCPACRADLIGGSGVWAGAGSETVAGSGADGASEDDIDDRTRRVYHDDRSVYAILSCVSLSLLAAVIGFVDGGCF